MAGIEVKSNTESVHKCFINWHLSLRSSSFGINDIEGMKLLTKMRVNFSDLRSDRFSHNFICDIRTCTCFLEDESSSHFLLRCPRYLTIRNKLIDSVSTIIGSDISILPDNHLTDILLFGGNVYNDKTNKLIILETIEFIKISKRFNVLEAFNPGMELSDHSVL